MEKKYWEIMFILEMVLLMALLDASKDLINHGMVLVGNGLKLVILFYIFYKIWKNVDELIS